MDASNCDFLLVRSRPDLSDHFLGMRSGLCSDVELGDLACGKPRSVAVDDFDDIGGFTADRFFLYLSNPGPAGSVYSRLSEFPFS